MTKQELACIVQKYADCVDDLNTPCFHVNPSPFTLDKVVFKSNRFMTLCDYVNTKNGLSVFAFALYKALTTSEDHKKMI